MGTTIVSDELSAVTGQIDARLLAEPLVLSDLIDSRISRDVGDDGPYLHTRLQSPENPYRWAISYHFHIAQDRQGDHYNGVSSVQATLALLKSGLYEIIRNGEQRTFATLEQTTEFLINGDSGLAMPNAADFR